MRLLEMLISVSGSRYSPTAFRNENYPSEARSTIPIFIQLDLTQQDDNRCNTFSIIAHIEAQSSQPGIYQIYNYAASSDIALDLSGGDLKSILGFPAHQGSNQKALYLQNWELLSLGKGYSIRSLHTGDYLTVEDELCDLTPVVANPYPVSWALTSFAGSEEIWRITWPNAKLTVGLPENVGNEPNALARLVKIDSFGTGSLWRFVPERIVPDTVSTSALEDVQRATSMPPVSSTTTDTKMGDDGSVTITTTTTTVITTVTKVSKIVVSSKSA